MIDPVRNFAKAVVSTGYDQNATTIVLSTGHGARLPDPATEGAFNLPWWNSTTYPDPADDGSREIVRCTGRAGDVLTVVRGQEGTSPVAHNTPGCTYSVVLSLTRKTVDDVRELTDNKLVQSGNQTVNEVGDWIIFKKSFTGAATYIFFAWTDNNGGMSLVTSGTIAGGTRLATGIMVYPPEDGTPVNFIAIGA